MALKCIWPVPGCSDGGGSCGCEVASSQVLGDLCFLSRVCVDRSEGCRGPGMEAGSWKLRWWQQPVLNTRFFPACQNVWASAKDCFSRQLCSPLSSFDCHSKEGLSRIGRIWKFPGQLGRCSAVLPLGQGSGRTFLSCSKSEWVVSASLMLGKHVCQGSDLNPTLSILPRVGSGTGYYPKIFPLQIKEHGIPPLEIYFFVFVMDRNQRDSGFIWDCPTEDMDMMEGIVEVPTSGEWRE